jgi:hypothetical protein
MVAVFGTMTADGPHKVLGIPYEVTTVGYLQVTGHGEQAPSSGHAVIGPAADDGRVARRS